MAYFTEGKDLNTLQERYSLLPMESSKWKRNTNQPEWDAEGEQMLGAYRRIAGADKDISGYSYVFLRASGDYRVYRFIMNSGTSLQITESLKDAVRYAKGAIDAD